MSEDSSMSRILQGHLDRLRSGDEQARDALIGHACNRLVALTRKMLGKFSRLRAWEQTDDVAQNAMLRLRRALQDVKPETVREFIGLASLQIRRELLDLTRHYYPDQRNQGDGDGSPQRATPHTFLVRSQAHGADEEGHDQDVPYDDATHDPGTLDIWRRFHEAVQELPETEREVAELLWYQELTQEEAAEILNVDKSTVKRRWRSARLKLSDVLADLQPGGGSSEKNSSEELPP